MPQKRHVVTDIELKNRMKAGIPTSGLATGHFPGLTWTLSKAGTAAWIYRYSFAGKKKAMDIGRYPDISISVAKLAAMEASVKTKNGIDPALEKARAKKARASDKTFTDLAKSYMARKFQDMRPNSVRVQKGVIENDILPHLGKLPAREIKGDDIMERLEAIGKRSYRMAKRARTVIEAIFRHGIALRIITQNPCPSGKHLTSLLGKEPKEKDKRFLSEEELRFLLSTIGDSSNADVLRILLGTGVRITELTEAQWQEIDLYAALWYLSEERKKEKREYLCPLSPFVLEAFRRLKVRSNGSPWVLPSRIRHSTHPHISDATVRCYIDAFIEKHPGRILRFTPHDCRHTASTHLSILGIDYETRERCLNHAVGSQLSRRYTHDKQTHAIRNALNLLSDFLTACETGAPWQGRDNVIPLNFLTRQQAGN